METNRLSRRTFTISAGTFAALIAGYSNGVVAVAAQEVEYPEIKIEAMEYHFTMPAESDAGFSRLVMENTGAVDHHAIFFRINDDATPDDFQSAMMSGDLAALLAVSRSYGGPGAGPGESGAVVANLDPGMYMVVCVIPDEEGIPHAAHGMVAPLTVSETVGVSEAPTADAVISLADYAFEGLSCSISTDKNVWEITNNAEQLHELLILKLAEGVTVDALLAMMEAEAPAATPGAEAPPPPFILTAGVAPMSMDAVNYLELELEAGSYAAICFVPDIASGAPHFMLGMIAGFEVA